MNKLRMELKLFHILKDNLEFDRDILGIVKILEKILDNDKEEAIKAWTYLLERYDIKSLAKDLDFTPLLKDFSGDLIEKVGLDKFLEIRKNLGEDKQFLIDLYVFNCYQESAIIEVIQKLIMKEEFLKERKLIEELKEKEHILRKEFFNLDDLLKVVVELHIKLNKINGDFLKSLIEMASLEKEKALLLALIIDYI